MILATFSRAGFLPPSSQPHTGQPWGWNGPIIWWGYLWWWQCVWWCDDYVDVEDEYDRMMKWRQQFTMNVIKWWSEEDNS